MLAVSIIPHDAPAQRVSDLSPGIPQSQIDKWAAIEPKGIEDARPLFAEAEHRQIFGGHDIGEIYAAQACANTLAFLQGPYHPGGHPAWQEAVEAAQNLSIRLVEEQDIRDAQIGQAMMSISFNKQIEYYVLLSDQNTYLKGDAVADFVNDDIAYCGRLLGRNDLPRID